MRPRRRLGLLLLKKFKQTKRSGQRSKNPKNARAKHKEQLASRTSGSTSSSGRSSLHTTLDSSPSPRLSFFTQEFKKPSQKPKKLKNLKKRETQESPVGPVASDPLPLAVLPETQPPELLPATLELPEPPKSLEPEYQQLSFDNSFLTIHQMIKPDDRLRQSIEAFLLDQRSPHTRKAYQKDLKRFIKFLLFKNIDTKIEQLNRTVLIAYKESLISEGLEHTTIDRHLATLRSFFGWLVDDGLISKSPADGVRFLNPKRISRTIGFSDEEVRRVLATPNLHTRSGSMHYAILMVLFYCGLRRSELCSLRTINLGMERNQRVLRLRGKGNAERMIVVIPPVWSALKHFFFIARRDFSKDEYLFLPLKNNRTGVLNKPLDPSMIFYIVTRYSKLAGISNRVSPHSCRATAISNARDHNVPDRAIQEFAGWASPDMITRYDKRKSNIEDSAAHSIQYGSENRSYPDGSYYSEEALGAEQPSKPERSD